MRKMTDILIVLIGIVAGYSGYSYRNEVHLLSDFYNALRPLHAAEMTVSSEYPINSAADLIEHINGPYQHVESWETGSYEDMYFIANTDKMHIQIQLTDSSTVQNWDTFFIEKTEEGGYHTSLGDIKELTGKGIEIETGSDHIKEFYLKTGSGGIYLEGSYLYEDRMITFEKENIIIDGIAYPYSCISEKFIYMDNSVFSSFPFYAYSYDAEGNLLLKSLRYGSYYTYRSLPDHLIITLTKAAEDENE